MSRSQPKLRAVPTVAEPGDVYRDQQGQLWEVVAICREPTVTVERLFKMEEANARQGEMTRMGGGKCRVPLWVMGCPSGFCDEQAYGVQLPYEILYQDRHYDNRDGCRPPYCHGPCCPGHGGPRADEIRVFQDGLTNEGRVMWCAVYPDFINLQESPAGFDGNALVAREKLRAEAMAASAVGDSRDAQ